MQQLSIFSNPEPTPAPAKVLQFRQPIAPAKLQEESTEAIYPEYKYGACVPCGRSILIPGLDSAKCECCGWTEQRRKRGTVPVIVPTTPAKPEPLPMSDPITKEPPTVPKVSPTTNTTGKILTFAITTKRSAEMGVADPLLTGKKTCTRRLVTGWTASTVSWYQRAFDEGLNIQAWTAIPIAPESRKLADIRLTQAIYQEALKDMPDEDLEAEGGLWSSKDEFIETVCKGKPDSSLKVWVVRFELVNICT